jgi:hypothetical protein
LSDSRPSSYDAQLHYTSTICQKNVLKNEWFCDVCRIRYPYDSNMPMSHTLKGQQIEVPKQRWSQGHEGEDLPEKEEKEI